MTNEPNARRIAFLYAGQGAQAPGMGKDLYDAFPVYREAFDAVDPDGSIAHLCFEASAEELGQTRNTQPAMVAEGIAITALLTNHGITPAMVAGLSLGEYTALATAGIFTPKQAVELVAFRGLTMERASEGLACGMVAVLGMDAAQVHRACCEARIQTGQVVEPANFNAPGQIVISGESTAVDCAAKLLLEMGAKRCMPLAVNGPFHTSLMEPAGNELHERFAAEKFGVMDIPVVFNATGDIIQEDQTVAGLLEKQVQSSVHFDESIRTMTAAGITTFVEIGPGKTLSKLVRRIDKSLEALNVEDIASLEKTLATLEGVCND